MRSVKVSEARGAVLDWLVAKCEGVNEETFSLYYTPTEPSDLDKHGYPEFHYSSVWAQGGPIITREIDALRKRSKAEEADLAHPNPNFKFKAEIFADIEGYFCGFGPTPLIAAMRCYCCAKLGDIVEVPEELCQ